MCGRYQFTSEAETGRDFPVYGRTGKPSYVILTTEANASMREVYHRMPLVLTKEQVAPWLAELEAAGKCLRMTPPQFEKTPADTQISLW